MARISAHLPDAAVDEAIRYIEEHGGIDIKIGRTPKTPSIPISGPWPSVMAFIELWNEATPDACAAVQVASEARRRKIRQYLHQFPDEQFWRDVFTEIGRSRFLSGLVERPNGGKPWIATMEWCLSRGRDGVENAVKVHEGRYRD